MRTTESRAQLTHRACISGSGSIRLPPSRALTFRNGHRPRRLSCSACPHAYSGRRDRADFAAANQAWLRVYRLPAYAPDLNPAEGIWSLLKQSMANFAAADLDGLVRLVKRKLKKIQYRPHLIHGCLAATGLKIEPW